PSTCRSSPQEGMCSAGRAGGSARFVLFLADDGPRVGGAAGVRHDRGVRRPAADRAAEPHQGVVLAVCDPFLEGNQGVVGDLDVFRAHLRAALGDVAVAHAELFLGDLAPVGGVPGMHLQFGHAHEVTGPGEVFLVLLVVTDHVAHVVAQEALDAFAELLAALDIFLLHTEVTGCGIRGRGERGDLACLVIVEGHIAHQVPYDGEGLEGDDRDDLVGLEDAHPGHAGQPWHAVDLHRTRAALARLAVPAHRQVGDLGGLEPKQYVEDDLALVGLDLVHGELSVAGAAPHTENTFAQDSSSSVRYLTSSSRSKSFISSAGMSATGIRDSVIASPSARTARLTRRHSDDMSGKSSRVCPPRDSVRSNAALVTASDTSIMFGRASARCQPGLYTRSPGALSMSDRCRSSASRSRARSISGALRMMPTRSFMVSWSSECTVYGLSPLSCLSGARVRETILDTAVSDTPPWGRLSAWAAAPMPARRPKTKRSDSEF